MFRAQSQLIPALMLLVSIPFDATGQELWPPKSQKNPPHFAQTMAAAKWRSGFDDAVLIKQISEYVTSSDFKNLEQTYDDFVAERRVSISGTESSIVYVGTIKKILEKWRSCNCGDHEGFLERWSDAYPEAAALPIVRARFYLQAIILSEEFDSYGAKGLLQFVSDSIKTNPRAFKLSPAGYETLLTYTLLATWDEEPIELVMNEAFKVFPHDAYIAFNAVRYADNDSLVATAEIAAKYSGDRGYAEIYSMSRSIKQHADVFRARRVNWARFVHGMDQSLAEYRSSELWSTYLTSSCEFGDVDKSRSIVTEAKKLGVSLDSDQC